MTITIAVVDETFGTVTPCEPSLGTFEASTIGNVIPPSVDNRMSTSEQATGAAFVPATLHETVSVESPAQEIPLQRVRSSHRL